MNHVELAWFNYEQSNRRIDACRAKGDAFGLAIAETSAKHWHDQWEAELRLADAEKAAAAA